MKLSVVIPAYNEGTSIAALVESLRGRLAAVAGGAGEILVIDDGSSDETAARAEAAGAKVIRHRLNRGYGAALKTGLRAAAGEVVVTLDADGQHDPADLARLVSRLDGADMVVGCRDDWAHSPAWRWPGKWLLGKLANYLSGRTIPDLNCGFRAVRREVALKYMHLCPNGFSFSTTITVALLCQGCPVEFEPITAQPRQAGSRSLVGLRAAAATFLLMLRLITLFNPLKIFLPASFISGLAGLLWGSYYIFLGRGLTTAALLLIVTGVLLFFFGLLTDQVSAFRRERYE